MRRLVLAACLFAGFALPSFADPAMTTAFSQMRRAPNPHARIVQGVPANAEIDLQGCDGDWCHASWRNLAGYIPAFAVAQGGPPPAMAEAPPPLVVTAPAIVIGPSFGWGGPYVGGAWGGGYGWRHW